MGKVMKRQSGFTLIELVIVIVILGLLAVTAAPRFLDLTDQAKQANIEGMAGGFATGVSLVRAQWEAEGRPTNVSNQNAVNYSGSTLVLTTEDEADNIQPGYPVGETDGAGLGSGFDSGNCEYLWNNILQQPPKASSNFANIDDVDYFVSKTGTGAASACIFYLKVTLQKDTNGNYVNPGVNTAVGNSFTYQPATSAVVVYINN